MAFGAGTPSLLLKKRMAAKRNGDDGSTAPTASHDPPCPRGLPTSDSVGVPICTLGGMVLERQYGRSMTQFHE